MLYWGENITMIVFLFAFLEKSDKIVLSSTTVCINISSMVPVFRIDCGKSLHEILEILKHTKSILSADFPNMQRGFFICLFFTSMLGLIFLVLLGVFAFSLHWSLWCAFIVFILISIFY